MEARESGDSDNDDDDDGNKAKTTGGVGKRQDQSSFLKKGLLGWMEVCGG